MLLQILVPHYHEPVKVVKTLLDSIALQQNVDFKEIGVLICHDGEDIEDLRFGIDYPFEVEQFNIPELGKSAARNALLDRATADYIMFCDSDDMFFNAVGLYIVFEGIKLGEMDSVTSVFVEETRLPGSDEIVYVNHEKDITFVHGKIHRRQFLVDENIRWNETLDEHEDSYFNGLVNAVSNNVKYCPISFYLWKWREDSACRHDPAFTLRTYAKFIDSNDALVEELLRRGIRDKATSFCASLIFDAYYTMNKPEWVKQKNKEYRRSTELRFADYFDKYKELWDEMPMDERMAISKDSRGRAVLEGMRMEDITIGEWLKHIQRLKRRAKC